MPGSVDAVADDEHLEEFRHKYEIPDDVIVTACAPGEVPVYSRDRWPVPILAVVYCGICFPLHPKITRFFHLTRMSPTQLTLNGWMVLGAMSVLDRLLSERIGLPELLHCYSLGRRAAKEGQLPRYYFNKRNDGPQFVAQRRDKEPSPDYILVSGNFWSAPEEGVELPLLPATESSGLPDTSELNSLRWGYDKAAVRLICEYPGRTPGHLFGASLPYPTTVGRKREKRLRQLRYERAGSPDVAPAPDEGRPIDTYEGDEFIDYSLGPPLRPSSPVESVGSEGGPEAMAPPKNYQPSGGALRAGVSKRRRIVLSSGDPPEGDAPGASSSQRSPARLRSPSAVRRGKRSSAEMAGDAVPLVIEPVTVPAGDRITTAHTIKMVVVALGLARGIRLPRDDERLSDFSAEELQARQVAVLGEAFVASAFLHDALLGHSRAVKEAQVTIASLTKAVDAANGRADAAERARVEAEERGKEAVAGALAAAEKDAEKRIAGAWQAAEERVAAAKGAVEAGVWDDAAQMYQDQVAEASFIWYVRGHIDAAAWSGLPAPSADRLRDGFDLAQDAIREADAAEEDEEMSNDILPDPAGPDPSPSRPPQP